MIEVYDPGADALARYPQWTIRHYQLPAGHHEALSWRRMVVVIDRRLGAAARRCALAHAIAHLDLGHHRTIDATTEAAEELAADKLACRRLLPVHLLADVLAEDPDQGRAAALLHVTEHVLEVRLRHLHPAERAAIKTRCAARDNAA